LNQPPRLRQLRWLRGVFLMAQPPRLNQGGEFLLTAEPNSYKDCTHHKTLDLDLSLIVAFS